MRPVAALKRLQEYVMVRMHDERSIAEHFRRQGATVGAGCRLLVKSLGTEPYLVSIGAESLISSEVLFVTHDGGTWVGRDVNPKLHAFGRIDIGKRCFIGTRSILLPGTRIGDRCVVGAGAVCRGTYPRGSVIAGVPARVIGMTEDYLCKAETRGLDLPEEVFPLDEGNRHELRAALERLLPQFEE